MALSTTAVSPDQRLEALDVLQNVLSDVLFAEFEPTHWSKKHDPKDLPAKKDFATKAFPVLARYHLGKEADALAANHEWLADLGSTIPSRARKASQIFLQDSAHNLTVLEVFMKLQYLKIWGSALMHQHPICCLCYKIYKIVKEEHTPRAKRHQVYIGTSQAGMIERARNTRDLEAKKMDQEFGGQWTDFLSQ